jgi:hypothetical protein
MARKRTVRLLPDEFIVESEDRPVNFTWPWAIDQRLDMLVDRVARAQKTNRKELIAALVLAAPDDGKMLKEIIETYRDAVVREALPTSEPGEGDNVIVLEAHRPGPRTGRS